MSKENLFQVVQPDGTMRLISAKNEAAVHKHLLGTIKITKVKDAMTVASLLTTLQASGGKLETATELPIESAIRVAVQDEVKPPVETPPAKPTK